MRKILNFKLLLSVALVIFSVSCKETNQPEKVAVQGVTVEPTTKNLVVGDEFTITATIEPSDASNKDVTWQSNASDIASVDATGKVKAIKAGTATITATTVDGAKTASCVVNVSDVAISVTGITLNPTEKTLSVGEEFTIVATIEPAEATNKDITWQSNASDIASVDATGKVKAIKAGTATITATTVDGNKTATCLVTVEENNALLTTKGVIIEDFTADWCGPCYEGMKNITKVLKNFDDRVMLVCHHHNDDFAISESAVLKAAYDITGIPDCMVNRTKVFGPTIPFHPLDLSATILKKQLEAATSVHIGMSTSYDESTKELKIEVKGKLLSELPKARLNVYLVQDSIIAPQAGGGSNYAHRNALRKVLSAGGAWGEALGVSVGNFSKTYTYTMPDKIGDFATKPDKMYVVAFVTEHHSTIDMKNNVVHNTIIKKIK